MENKKGQRYIKKVTGVSKKPKPDIKEEKPKIFSRSRDLKVI